MALSPTLFPVFTYRDAPAALDWLAKAFGFAQHVVYPNEDGGIGHAELKLDDGFVLMASRAKTADPANPFPSTPISLYAYVEDVDGHFAKAKAAGAEVVKPPHDTPYGSREYWVRDLEGNLWSFGSYHPVVGVPAGYAG